MQYRENGHFSEIILRKLSERQLINLFVDEISIRYNPSNLEVEKGGWKEVELMEATCGDKERYFKLVTGVVHIPEHTHPLLNRDFSVSN